MYEARELLLVELDEGGNVGWCGADHDHAGLDSKSHDLVPLLCLMGDALVDSSVSHPSYSQLFQGSGEVPGLGLGQLRGIVRGFIVGHVNMWCSSKM